MMVNEKVLMALIAAIPPTIAAAGGFVIGILNRRSIKSVEKTGIKTHKLVNGTLAIQYQVSAASARTLANFTNLPEHKVMADAAEKKLQDHLENLNKMGLSVGGIQQ